MAPAPAWAQLPLDLLGSILGRLPAMDHLSFAGVCVSWSAAVSSGVFPPAPHPPWLMLPAASNSRRRRHSARFLSLPGRRLCTLRQPDPPIRARAWIGSSPDGWLVTADHRSELHLLNPVTGAQFDLPSVTTFPFVDALHHGGGRSGYRLTRQGVPSVTVATGDLRYFLFVKAIAWWAPPSSSSSPATTTRDRCMEYTVALIYRPYERLAFARSGDRAWRTVDLLFAYGFADLIHHRGWLLTVDGFGQVAAWDLAETQSPAPRMLQARPPAAFATGGRGHGSRTGYLVESAATGALLQVVREGETVQGGGQRTAGFRVFRLEVGAMRWAEVEELGGEALFLGRGHSVAAMAGVEGNCVYFTDDFFGCPEVYFHGDGGDVGVFRMEDGSITKLLPGVDSPAATPSPIWITPTLR